MYLLVNSRHGSATHEEHANCINVLENAYCMKSVLHQSTNSMDFGTHYILLFTFQTLSLDEALLKIMEGRYSLIAYKYYITMSTVDEYGNSNFYISKKGIHIMAFFGWGFR